MLDFEAVKELLGGLLLRPCLVGAFAFLGAGVLCCLCRFCRKHLVGLWLHSRSQFVALVIAAGIATGVAQKTTNNVPPNLNSPLPQMMQGGISQAGFVGEGNLVNPVQTSLDDIARGYRQESMTTNLEPFAEMPSNAVEYARWSLRGGFAADFALHLGNFVFPVGTNRVSRFDVLSGGAVEPLPRGTSAAIYAAREQASLVPGVSRFWSADADDGAKVLRWDRVFAGRDSTGEYTAEMRFFQNGDFTTRSNEVETAYRRVNPDDWDDDGIANERDANPTSYDGDFFGVANALPSNANMNAYYWLDLSVRGLLDCATIRVTCDGPSDLGDHLIVARTNEVCHVPLLAGATYAVESDLPIDHSAVSSEYAEIVTNAENCLTVSLPIELSFGPVRMRSGGGSGDALTEEYVLQSEPIDVGASVIALSGGCCLCEVIGSGFTWICSEECECSGNGHVLSASATWEGYMHVFNWWGTCSCDREEPSECFNEGIGLLLEMQSTYIANDDDDDDDGIVDAKPSFSYMDDDIVTNRVLFAASTPTNGTVKLQRLTGLEQSVNGAKKVYADRTALAQIEEGHEYSVSNSDEEMWSYLVNPVVTSSHYLDGQVRALWKPESGPRASVSKRFTIIEPTIEPITDESWSMADFAGDGQLHSYLYNPCAVAVGKMATFKVDVLPEDYPDSEIVWTTSTSGGVVRFAGSNVNTGRVVTVEGVSAGDAYLGVHFGDAVSSMPKFEFKVLEPRTVKLRTWIIGNGIAWCRDADEVRSMVAQVNDIYAQVGVSVLLVEPIVMTNIPAAFDLAEQDPQPGQWSLLQLTALATGTDGLECYFVNSIDRTPRKAGAHHPGGMAISGSGNGVTLAHEIGHAFGLYDIYVSNESFTNSTVTLKNLPTNEWARAEHLPWDWNSGCIGHGEGGARFYGKGANMRTLIERMLMNGEYSTGASTYDITFGRIYGIWCNGSYANEEDWVIGVAPVGFFTDFEGNGIPVHQ